jgi:hypothetical protein
VAAMQRACRLAPLQHARIVIILQQGYGIVTCCALVIVVRPGRVRDLLHGAYSGLAYFQRL